MNRTPVLRPSPRDSRGVRPSHRLQIGLNAVPDAKGTGSAILNIGVTDIVAARRVLEGRGVVFRGETQIIPGKVSLAMFADPNGNALRLAGPAPRR